MYSTTDSKHWVRWYSLKYQLVIDNVLYSDDVPVRLKFDIYVMCSPFSAHLGPIPIVKKKEGSKYFPNYFNLTPLLCQGNMERRSHKD